MSATSICLPFLQRDGLSLAGRRIALAVREKQDVAVMIVQAHDVEQLCASLGHEQTGALLDDFFFRLQEIARDDDLIERIGDRKFAVLLNGLRNRGHVDLAAKKIERLARETAGMHEDDPELSTTIGVALCPSQGIDASELMRFAEIASLNGRHSNLSVCFFESDTADQMLVDWGMEKRLQTAMAAGDLELHYQPKTSIQTGAIVGAEALMRWYEPEIGPISPDVFINLAESTGQIAELTYFAIQSACHQLSNLRESDNDLNIAVNVTPSLIRGLEIIDAVRSATSIWGINLSSLTLEVTENALMEDREATHEILTELRHAGVRISIDDFGTGYSSLGYLKDIPADELKIDRSFVMGMLDNPDDFKIVKHTIEIARSFGLGVVAEGIESEAMLDELRKLGCDYGQGYFICKPVPSAEFHAFIQQKKSAASAEPAIKTAG